MKNTTNLRTPSDYRNTDSVLELLNTPKYQARVRRARNREAFYELRNRLTLYVSLIALGLILGFTLGILMV